MQVISVLQHIDVRLPAALERLFQAEGSANGWARLLAWECLLLKRVPQRTQAIARVLLVMALPFVFFATWTAFWLARFCYQRIAHRRAANRAATAQMPRRLQAFGGVTLRKYAHQHIVVTALVIAFLFYPVVSVAILSVFNCLALRDAPGNADFVPFEVLRLTVGDFWSGDTGLRCWRGPHRCTPAPLQVRMFSASSSVASRMQLQVILLCRCICLHAQSCSLQTWRASY